MPEYTVEEIQVERKPYQAPEVIHEMDLETRAGSPTNPIWLDPANPLP